MANINDITDILRNKAAGKKNSAGDYWGDHWCDIAADNIDNLRAEIQRLNNQIDDIYLDQAGEDG